MIRHPHTMSTTEVARTLESLSDDLAADPTLAPLVARRLANMTRDLRAGVLVVRP